jgi:hypothetical protein
MVLKSKRLKVELKVELKVLSIFSLDWLINLAVCDGKTVVFMTLLRACMLYFFILPSQ